MRCKIFYLFFFGCHLTATVIFFSLNLEFPCYVLVFVYVLF